MTRAQLDINVIIALLDSEHLHHEAANDWFADHASTGWATCPLTQNGTIRILANPRYAGSPGPPAAIAVVAKLCARSDHDFWEDSISLLDPAHVDRSRLPGYLQLTDTYLLALARAKSGRLVTFDRRIAVTAVADGARHVEVIG